MSSFVLKIIAVISMLSDHLGYVLFNKFTFMNYIGRLAFPIFAFSISEGYHYTKNLKKYFLRLTIFAVISQIPYMMFLSTFTSMWQFNTIFTLILGLLAIYIYDKCKNKYLGIFIPILFAIIAQTFNFDYGWFGIAIIFIFYIFKNKKILMNLYFILTAFIYYSYKYLIYINPIYFYIMFFCCLALIPINLYNEIKGKNTKYLLYVFYPLHLMMLYFLNFII